MTYRYVYACIDTYIYLYMRSINAEHEDSLRHVIYILTYIAYIRGEACVYICIECVHMQLHYVVVCMKFCIYILLHNTHIYTGDGVYIYIECVHM